ncbi:hypothetical protein PMIN06_009344 [Paraphaeosphaeria minitans]|uniref:Uncharacterized protein n=1 Tax=Paraphaeosphaeria minitans TaxID=565426 RepID=A0A9P6GH60_9PLEO|nr:hypothetical protein PMIN01_06403 [Paraphaeosphaeria minitans]
MSVLILSCFRSHRAPRAAASGCLLTATMAHFDSDAPWMDSVLQTTTKKLSAHNCNDNQGAELRAENTASSTISNWPRGAEAGTLVHARVSPSAPTNHSTSQSPLTR